MHATVRLHRPQFGVNMCMCWCVLQKTLFVVGACTGEGYAIIGVALAAHFIAPICV